MKENCLCIRNYINTDSSSAAFKDVREALVREINDPGVLDRSSILSDSSPLKKEAQIIIDAFEAVTNGMENPGAMEDLDSIDSRSPLFSWKCLTLAIDRFYRQDYAEMQDFLSKVEEISPAKQIEPVLLHLSGIEIIENPRRNQLRLIKSVQKDRSLFKDASRQIADAIEADSEDLFAETILLVARELKIKYPVEARRLALWSIKEAATREFSQGLFLKGYKLIFGNAEALRLFAIALKETEPDIAVLFWLQSLIERIKNADITEKETAAYISIINSELEKTESVDNDFLNGITSLTAKLRQDISLFFPSLKVDETEENPFVFLKKIQTVISGSRNSSSAKSGNGDIRINITDTGAKKKTPVQLSLF